MASDKAYLDYVLEQLPEGTSFRPMMNEYIIYYNGKVIGGIYDNRFLIKITETSLKMLKDCERALPYEGAKEMLVAEDFENREFMKELFEAMYDELPAPKKKKKN